jgi:hypothetical protein
MIELRFLRRSFVYATFVFGLLSFMVLPPLVRAPFPHATANFHADPAGIILIVMRELILMLPPVLAIVCAMAWITLRSNHRSAPRWAMAASSLFLVYSLPFFVAAIVILEYSMAGTFVIVGVFVSSLFFSALGVTGLACFSRSESLTPARVVVRHF